MKRLTQYIHPCSSAMFDYTKDGDLKKLIDKLREVEILASEGENTDQELWFKFFRGDCLAHRISDIEFALSVIDKKYMLEMFELTNQLENELEVYYS